MWKLVRSEVRAVDNWQGSPSTGGIGTCDNRLLKDIPR
jgi:hypothetical protein